MAVQQARSGFLHRGGPAIAVAAVHALVLYGMIVSLGIVEMPKFAAPIEAVFIPEQAETQPEPEIKIKPEIEQPVALDEPVPEVQYDEPVVPPTDIPAPVSQNAISGAPTNSAPAQDLKTATRTDPIYPPAARRAGEQGTVRLKVLVDTKGRPSTVEVAQSSGFPRLDQAAMDAVRKWRFVAATNGSNAITAWTQVAVTFRLTDAKA
jgi:periplasmic protein TonB